MLAPVIPALTAFDFASDVRAGLTRPGRKTLPCKYFYDEAGSALFEAICRLPEYGLTRADERLLRQHAHQMVDRVADRVPGPVAVAELGSGNGSKTRWLLEALCHRQPTFYYPVEISPSALAQCERALGDIESLRILRLESEYLDGLREVAARRKPGQRLFVLFLGSTIGNFDRAAGVQFLTEIRRILRPGDSMLLGTDLEKPVEQLLRAYDDDSGVTAAFNLNLLARINRELAGDFDVSQFTHVARFDSQHRRVEMHLRSRRSQRVRIAAAGIVVEFREGETIWTESSHKYLAAEIPWLARRAGFRCRAQWMDEEWPFAESLLAAE